MKAVILAGGAGTRLWPLSRTDLPKQFLQFKGKNESFFQLSFKRCLDLTDIHSIFIVTSKAFQYIIKNQIESLGLLYIPGNMLFEPEPKNTLPAIYYASEEIRKQNDDYVAFFPCDHEIMDSGGFCHQIKMATDLADKRLVTFGIKPTKAETAYGYIRPGKPLDNGFEVSEFKEKPDFKTAQLYVREGLFWNSGIFLFRTDVLHQEVKEYALEVFEAFRANKVEEKFKLSPRISIDYGVLEKSPHIAVFPIDMQWKDIGSFSALFEDYENQEDESKNVSFADSIIIDSHENLIYSNTNRVIAVIGIDNCAIIDQDDALLVCKSNQDQSVKKVVEQLKGNGDNRFHDSPVSFYSWGKAKKENLGNGFYSLKCEVMPHTSFILGSEFGNGTKEWVSLLCMKGSCSIHSVTTVLLNENENYATLNNSCTISTDSTKEHVLFFIFKEEFDK